MSAPLESDSATPDPIPASAATAPNAGPKIVTFGCRLNAHESQAMRELTAGCGDLIIVNTCAVTAEAERQARQTIRRLRRDNPEARVVVTGCAAQIAPDRWAALPEVDQVVGNREKLDAAIWSQPSPERVVVSDIMTARETAEHLIEGFDGRARAFVQAQQGCDHRCTFCIIPFGRGPSRSTPAAMVIEQVRALVAKGFLEVVLTGVDLTAWGDDLPDRPRLGDLAAQLLAAVPDLPRLRLSSLDPVEIDETLWRLWAEEPRLAPHLHLSAQHGADLILKRMARRHLRADLFSVAERALRLRPEAALGADLIAGFPTETEAHFQDMLDLVEQARFSWLHVFPFSPRSGTPAARMPQLPGPEIKARAARLRAAGSAAAERFMRDQIGREVVVLAERDGLGWTEAYAPARVEGATDGRLTRLRVTGLEPDGKGGARLTGERLADL